MIPQLRTVTLDGKEVTDEKEFLKEFSTSVYIALYDKWNSCDDANIRKLTTLLYRSTCLLLSLWKDNKPYLWEFATKWYEQQPVAEGDEDKTVKILPLSLPAMMRVITPNDFVKMVDDFADELPKDYLEAKCAILDETIAPLSDEKQQAEKN